MLPRAGLNFHSTARFEVPLTMARNFWVWEASRVVERGVNEMLSAGLAPAGRARATMQTHMLIPAENGVALHLPGPAVFFAFNGRS